MSSSAVVDGYERLVTRLKDDASSATIDRQLAVIFDSARIVIPAHPWIPGEAVSAIYRRLCQPTPGRPMSLRQLHLAIFVRERAGQSWPQIRRGWNDAYRA